MGFFLMVGIIIYGVHMSIFLDVYLVALFGSFGSFVCSFVSFVCLFVCLFLSFVSLFVSFFLC